MNREHRRALARARYRAEWLVAVEECEFCGAPVCPRCGFETAKCECCGEYSCEVCAAYVAPPVHGAN